MYWFGREHKCMLVYRRNSKRVAFWNGISWIIFIYVDPAVFFTVSHVIFLRLFLIYYVMFRNCCLIFYILSLINQTRKTTEWTRWFFVFCSNMTYGIIYSSGYATSWIYLKGITSQYATWYYLSQIKKLVVLQKIVSTS